jgi:Fe2+ transport system protein FeoA
MSLQNPQAKAQQILTLKQISSSEEGSDSMIERLYDLGLYEGIEIKIIRRVSFGHITIIQFNHTLLALNETEMLCLKF